MHVNVFHLIKAPHTIIGSRWDKFPSRLPSDMALSDGSKWWETPLPITSWNIIRGLSRDPTNRNSYLYLTLGLSTVYCRVGHKLLAKEEGISTTCLSIICNQFSDMYTCIYFVWV